MLLPLYVESMSGILLEEAGSGLLFLVSWLVLVLVFFLLVIKNLDNEPCTSS
jgi:hypothetical protein